MTAGLTVKVNVDDLVAKLKDAGARVNEQQLLLAIGQRQLRWINDNFKAGGIEKRWKPLASSTVYSRRKGSNVPLQDRGTMRQSFNVKLGRGSVKVGSQLYYTAYHEDGTGKYIIRPKEKKALAFASPKGSSTKGKGKNRKAYVFTKIVHHPGVPARPMLPSLELARRMAVETANNIVSKYMERFNRNGSR